MVIDGTRTTQIQEEIKKRSPFAMQIDVHGVSTQFPEQRPAGHNYHPLDLWESIHRPLVKDVKGKRILDVGCNAGFFSFEMAKRGAEVLGVDVNQVERVFNLQCMPLQQAEWIESELKTTAKFKELNFMECDESHPYDKILFLGVYYHLEDPSAGLAKLNRLLKMGGEIYVESESDPETTRYYADDEAYRLDKSNFLIPTPEYLNADMKKNGFTIVETFKVQNVCCGSRYAFRAIKTSDNPNPSNSFTVTSSPQQDPFTHAVPLQTKLKEIKTQVLPTDMSDDFISKDQKRIQNEINKRGTFFQNIDVKGVTTTNLLHPIQLWNAIKVDLKDVKNKRVLDVGCNAGFFSFELAKLGADVLGIDSNQADELAQTDGYFLNQETYPDWISQAEWIESELNTGAIFKKMNFFDCHEYETYDKILFLGVYYHISEPSKGLKHLNKLLKVGGEVILESEINHTDSKYYTGEEVYDNDCSVYLVPTPAYIHKDLEHNGFKILNTYTIAETNRDGEFEDYNDYPKGYKFNQNYYADRRHIVRAVKVKDVAFY